MKTWNKTSSFSYRVTSPHRPKEPVQSVQVLHVVLCLVSHNGDVSVLTINKSINKSIGQDRNKVNPNSEKLNNDAEADQLSPGSQRPRLGDLQNSQSPFHRRTLHFLRQADEDTNGKSRLYIPREDLSRLGSDIRTL